jgi:hypothetical protein
MGCNCAKKSGKTTYVHTASDGAVRVYSTEIEAKAAVARRGGSYSPQK